MAELHDELLLLEADWPDTPDLVEAVLATPAPAARRRRPWKPALAALLATVAVVMAVEPARSTVLEWLGLKSVEVERREPTPVPGATLQLGIPLSAGEARERYGDLAGPPSGLGDPGGIYAHDGGVAFVYADPDVLVQRFPGRVREFIQKTVGAAASLERLRVGGDPAYWIEGAHGFAYRNRDSVDYEDQRIAGNTLLVERPSGELIRVEGDVDRDRAIAIAESVPG
ncbi:MAG: hypothetical protein ABW060_12910 [Solirubrobacteraceae bacterium]